MEKADGAKCNSCNWEGPIKGLDSYMESESWELPQEYEVHICPKCGEDIDEYYLLSGKEKDKARIATLEAKLEAVKAWRDIAVIDWERMQGSSWLQVFGGLDEILCAALSPTPNSPVVSSSGGEEGRTCKCTFAQSMVGDGCDVCNPEMAEEIRRENEREEGGEDD